MPLGEIGVGELRAHGVTVWLDRDKIMPGQFWQDAIRQAIREGDYFIACFSAESVARPQTYMHTEIGLAIEMLQQMPTNRIWFIPVLLSECKVPDRSIGGGQTLRDLHWEFLYKDWEKGIRRAMTAMGVEISPAESTPAKPVKPVVSASLDLLIVTYPIPLELVRVPAGEFLMGSDPAKDEGAFDDEKPQHRLSLPEFYIGKYPVTNEQYAVFVEQAKGAAPVHWQGGKIPSGKEKHPVVNVSWYDARAFCEWVSEATGEIFRLPSEAEWEKAARGVNGQLYPWWGNQSPSADLCNFEASKIGHTTPVDRYPKGASPYGALDMAGNVSEWTGSLWGKDRQPTMFGYPSALYGYPYNYNPTDGREDLEAANDVRRVVRGGSCNDDGRFVRCAYRDRLNPVNRYVFIGFRVVCVSPPS